MTQRINKNIEEVLDEQFPKGKCKERGHALVLVAIAQLEINNLEKEIKRLKDLLQQFSDYRNSKPADTKPKGSFVGLSVGEKEPTSAEDKTADTSLYRNSDKKNLWPKR